MALRRVWAVVVVVALSLVSRAEEFTITYWVGPPPAQSSVETYRLIAEAGFTHAQVTFGGDEAENRRVLEACRVAGLKVIATDAAFSAASVVGAPDWQKKIEAVVKRYESHPALAGWGSQDEPAVAHFAGLAQIKAELLRHDPSKLVFINLFPTYATPDQLGAPNYSAYLEAYATTVRPQFVCYDHYALMADGGRRGDYFQNMELVRRSALAQNVPAWNGILSFPHFGYADPTEAQMRWQVYTSLAGGMKAVSWFTLFPPGGELGPKPAIFDDKGKPARLYPIVKQLNAEARQLGRTLTGLTSTGVYFSGPAPAGCVGLPGDAPVKVVGETPLMVGFFKGAEGRRFVMVTNVDDKNAADVRLMCAGKVWVVSTLDGTERAFEREGDEMRLILPAGDGRLFGLTP